MKKAKRLIQIMTEIHLMETRKEELKELYQDEQITENDMQQGVELADKYLVKLFEEWRNL